MPRGGYRPGAGRPRKGESRSGEEAESAPEQPISTGPDAVNPTESRTPLQFMLDVMNDPSQPANRRDRMAIAAAPFVHPKAGEQGKKDERAEAAKKAGTGKFAPAAPPKSLVVN